MTGKLGVSYAGRDEKGPMWNIVTISDRSGICGRLGGGWESLVSLCTV